MANIMLLPENVRHSLIAWRKELNAMGIRSTVTSTVRSTAKQSKLYSLYQQGLTNYPVAPPGRSLHEHGRAVDMVVRPANALPVAAQVGSRYGFKWAGSKDTVHFSYVFPVQAVVKGFRKAFRSPKIPKPRVIASKEFGWQAGKRYTRQILDLPSHCK